MKMLPKSLQIHKTKYCLFIKAFFFGITNKTVIQQDLSVINK